MTLRSVVDELSPCAHPTFAHVHHTTGAAVVGDAGPDGEEDRRRPESHTVPRVTLQRSAHCLPLTVPCTLCMLQALSGRSSASRQRRAGSTRTASTCTSPRTRSTPPRIRRGPRRAWRRASCTTSATCRAASPSARIRRRRPPPRRLPAPHAGHALSSAVCIVWH